VLSQLPIGDATVIIFMAPVFTAIFANVFMGETMTQAEVGLMMLSTFGVLLVARPTVLGFEGDPPPSYATSPRSVVFAIGIVGASCSAMTNLLVRQLTDVHAMVTITWLFISNTLSAPLLLYAFRMQPITPSGVNPWLCVLGIGLVGFAGQGFKTLGLKWEKAGPGTMMRNLDLFFAFTYQYFIFNEPMHTLSVVGAGLTLVSSIGVGVLKLQRKRTEKARKSPAPDSSVLTADGSP
jgi:drug/metabolite transporter (DMT)-like permease